MRLAVSLLLVFLSACAPRPAPAVAPKVTPEQLALQLNEADRLASRGCYLCLKEAAAAYSALLALSDDPVLARKALENNLMLVIREIELRLPDSGAREAAEQLQARLPASYAMYFDALDVLGSSREAPQYVRGNELFVPAERRAMLAKLVTELEKEWPASAMKAYFYLATALNTSMVAELKAQLDAILSTHSTDLSLKYRTQAFLPLFSTEAARELIGQETGFGEVHFLIGQRAILNRDLGSAFRELTRAHELLPDSASISLVFGNVQMSYARYAEALAQFDRVLSAGPDEAALLGRARALSYLRRHEEAIAAIDESLKDAQTNPGEKYYWRAWNRLQMGQSQVALDDAMMALNAMRNNQVYNLAGMAAFSLSRFAESRDYFDNALQMDRADCDSARYLGQIDSVERSWKAAAARYSQASACYEQAIVRMRKELATYEEDITGLSNGLITAKRAQIKDAEALRVNTLNNAAVASKNAGLIK
jgi:tetratricopeptide (TPR) repeat protein